MAPSELTPVSSTPVRTTWFTRWFIRFAYHLALLAAAMLLFSAAFPNPVFRWGVGALAFVALVPVVLLVRSVAWWATPIWGALYGFCTYAVFNYWLGTFHPLAIFIVPVIYATYFLVLFPLLKLVDVAFRGHWRVFGQVALWMAYEYFRTRFYLGYAYGIVGYTQYNWPLFIQSAELAGVWITSFLVAFPGIFAAHAWIDHREGALRARFRRLWPAGAYAILFAANLAYGAIAPVDFTEAPTWRVALIQQNIDPWVGGFRAYERSLDALIRQSDRAIANDDPDIVIWSETSFVPSIAYHTRYREDQERYELVRRLLDYLSDQEVPFVVGNSDGRLVRRETGELDRVDYNAVLVFDGEEVVDTYRKIHLVPFTEHFPYEKQLPWLYRLLVENDTNFWEHGTEYTVFSAAGVRFSTPICFEDTFGYLSRDFVRAGAEVIVNMTNDLWSYSESSAMQHMGMAVFRAVENRRSLVRSTNGGMTTIVDPNGVIQAIYPPFVEGYLSGDVPVYTGKTTLYTRRGDWLAWFFVAAGVASTICAGAALLFRRRRAVD